MLPLLLSSASERCFLLTRLRVPRKACCVSAARQLHLKSIAENRLQVYIIQVSTPKERDHLWDVLERVRPVTTRLESAGRMLRGFSQESSGRHVAVWAAGRRSQAARRSARCRSVRRGLQEDGAGRSASLAGHNTVGDGSPLLTPPCMRFRTWRRGCRQRCGAGGAAPPRSGPPEGGPGGQRGQDRVAGAGWHSCAAAQLAGAHGGAKEA